MDLRLFDLHCDTPSAIYGSASSLANNPHHVSLDKASPFSQYVQVMAIWSNRAMNDACAFSNFHKIADHLMDELEEHEDRIAYVRTASGLEQALNAHKHAAFLAVEDARILENTPERLPVLYARGVRFITPVWGGESCIGGAHDTSLGLTDFGKQIVSDCCDLGIIPDISHASLETADDIFAIADEKKRPVIATHSDAYAICPHTRNLRDDQFIRIKETGGLVGICLCPPHLSRDPQTASLSDIIKHIEHYLSLGGENVVAMGADLDGTDLPRGFSHVGDLVKIAEELAKLGYTDHLIDKLFFANAEQFIKGNL